MIKKLKISSHKIEWYDIKTKTKKTLRSLVYSRFIQIIICKIIIGYMWLVYISCKKKFFNTKKYLKAIKQNQALIISFWHNRLIMIPFITRFAYKINPEYKFITLASHHGDGQFVGRIMTYFGFQNIYGSSKRGRKKNRGIDFHSLRKILRELKNGKALGITPDGPRGPNQKINSEIINIAKISGAAILPVSYSCSRFLQFNSWDKFKVPLPFSKLNFYFEDLIFVDKSINKKDEESIKKLLEDKMNFAQKQSEI